jgi:hypothetical protein
MDDRKDGIIWQKDAGVEIRQDTETASKNTVFNHSGKALVFDDSVFNLLCVMRVRKKSDVASASTNTVGKHSGQTLWAKTVVQTLCWKDYVGKTMFAT